MKLRWDVERKVCMGIFGHGFSISDMRGVLSFIDIYMNMSDYIYEDEV